MLKPVCDPRQKRKWIKNFQKIVRERKEEDMFFDLAVTNLSGKIVGGVEVYQVEGDDINVKAEVVLRMKDEYLIQQKGEAFIQTIMDLRDQYGWFPEGIILRDESKNSIEI